VIGGQTLLVANDACSRRASASFGSYTYCRNSGKVQTWANSGADLKDMNSNCAKKKFNEMLDNSLASIRTLKQFSEPRKAASNQRIAHLFMVL